MRGLRKTRRQKRKQIGGAYSFANPDDACLQLAKASEHEQAKKIYRSAVLKFHPDKGGNAEEFQKLGYCFETFWPGSPSNVQAETARFKRETYLQEKDPQSAPPRQSARQEAARQEAARQAERRAYEEEARRRADEEQAAQEPQRRADEEAARQEAARQEAARQQAARQQAARQEAARQQAARQEALRKAAEEAARQEALRQEALRQEALRQEALRQEALRQEALRQEALRQKALREAAKKAKEKADRKKTARKEEDEKRRARIKSSRRIAQEEDAIYGMDLDPRLTRLQAYQRDQWEASERAQKEARRWVQEQNALKEAARQEAARLTQEEAYFHAPYDEARRVRNSQASTKMAQTADEMLIRQKAYESQFPRRDNNPPSWIGGQNYLRSSILGHHLLSLPTRRARRFSSSKKRRYSHRRRA